MRFRNIVVGLLVAGVLAPAAGTFGESVLAATRPPRNAIGIRLVDAPVSARADSRAWRYIIDHLSPGSVIHRRVEVANMTGAPQHLVVFAAAAVIRDQRFRFAPGRTPNELSAWTTTKRPEVILAPRSRSMVPITITVPGDAAPGERYAVIWAEAAKAAPLEGGIKEVNRVGVRIYLSVGRGNPPPADFTIDSLTAQRSRTGQQVVLARVHNTGGRALDLSGDLRLTHGPGSLSAGPFRVQLGTTLAPGDYGAVTVPLNEQVPDGPWRARLRLESGLAKRSTEATIRFPLAMGTGETVKAGTDRTYLPVGLAVGILLSALMATRFLRTRRSRRTRPHPDKSD